VSVRCSRNLFSFFLCRTRFASFKNNFHWIVIERSAEYEALTVAFMKSYIFWHIMPFNSVIFNRRFGGAYRLPLRFRRIILARNQHEKSSKQCKRTSIIEDGDNNFLRSYRFSKAYKALYRRRYRVSTMKCLDFVIQDFYNETPDFKDISYK
jgi:hypothetical protein